MPITQLTTKARARYRWLLKQGVSNRDAVALADSVTQDDLVTGSRASSSVLTPVDTPPGFSWTSHPLVGKLFVDQHGVFSTTLDPVGYKNAGGTTYFVDVAPGVGNDANDGLSAATPLLRLTTAIAKSDVGTIMIKGYGMAQPYYRSRGFNGTTIGKPINIISYGGDDAVITTHDVPVWTKTAGQTYVYQTTRSTVDAVYDVADATGTPGDAGLKLTKVASIAACDALQGSWYTDGTTTYVRASNSRAADANIWPLLLTKNLENIGDWNTYLEGIRLYGGVHAAKIANATSAGGRVVATRCEFHAGGTSFNGFTVQGMDSIAINCRASRSNLDGFNYHLYNGRICRSIEITCDGSDNGSGSGDQQSTAHDGCKIIRVGGSYRNSFGGNVVDVNDGTETWMLGCDLDTAGFWNIKCGNDTGTPKMWLHGVRARNAQWSVYAYGNAQVKIRGGSLPRVSGNVGTY